MAENNNETQKVTKTFPDGGRAVLTIDRNGVILDYQLERGAQPSTTAAGNAAAQYESRILDLERRVQGLGGYEETIHLSYTDDGGLFGGICLPFAAKRPENLTLLNYLSFDMESRKAVFMEDEDETLRPFRPYWISVSEEKAAFFEEGLVEFKSTFWEDPFEELFTTSPLILEREGLLDEEGKSRESEDYVYCLIKSDKSIRVLPKDIKLNSSLRMTPLLRIYRADFKPNFGFDPNN